MTKEEVLAKLVFDVELRGLSKNTKAEYYTKVKLFQEHYNKPANELGEEDIRLFLHYLTTERKLASGSGKHLQQRSSILVWCHIQY